MSKRKRHTLKIIKISDDEVLEVKKVTLLVGDNSPMKVIKEKKLDDDLSIDENEIVQRLKAMTVVHRT